MQKRKLLKRTFIDNWQPKLICLLLAVLVWFAMYKWIRSEEAPTQDINELLLSLPE